MSRTHFRTVLALAGLTLSLSVAPINGQTAAPAASVPAANAAAPAKTSAAIPAKTKDAPVPYVAPPQKGMVWVNTASGAYHTEGMKYYGRTKQGKYMTEADAIKAGYHSAKKAGKS